MLVLFEKDTVLIRGYKSKIQTKTQDTSKSKTIGNHYNQETVTYQVTSRNGFHYISISQNEVLISSDKSLQTIQTFQCDKDDWNAIQTILDTIDKSKLNSLTAPTDKRLYDGAAHASISINIGDMSHMTPSFDEGFPPKEIENLVNKVLAVADKVKKQ